MLTVRVDGLGLRNVLGTWDYLGFFESKVLEFGIKEPGSEALGSVGLQAQGVWVWSLELGLRWLKARQTAEALISG